MRFDKIDCLVLGQLDRNGRQSIAELARSTRLTRDRVEYRLNRLRSNGTIRGFTTIIDPAKLGLTIYKSYLRLENQPQRIEEILKQFRRHPHVYWIAQSAGRWDPVFAMLSPTAKRFYDMHTELLSPFSRIILDLQVSAFVDVWLRYRKHLSDESHGGEFFYGGEPTATVLDRIDHRLLSLLSKDARMSILQLSEALSISSPAVIYRIDRLENLGIIVGYRANLSLEKLGLVTFKAQLYFSEFSARVESDLRRYCLRHRNITYYGRQIGPAAIEIEIEVPDYPMCHKVLDELRAEFTGKIRNIDTIFFRDAELFWNLSGG